MIDVLERARRLPVPTPHRPARLGSGPVRTVRLTLARHRRLFAVVLLLAATWLVVRSAAPPPPQTRGVLVAVRDLPAGSLLTTSDLRVVPWPLAAVPAGGLTSGAGRVLAGPVRAGEPLTDARVLGPDLLVGQPAGTVAVPVRPGDPSIVAMLRAGDRVDVLGSTPSDSAVEGTGRLVVVRGATVLAAGTTGGDGVGAQGTGGFGLLDESGGSLTSGAALLVLAVSPEDAERLAAAQGRFLSIAILARPQP